MSVIQGRAHEGTNKCDGRSDGEEGMDSRYI